MSNSKPINKEKSLLEIFHIIYKRKLILVFTVFIFLTIAYFYSQNTAPVYESSAKLKKEVVDKKQIGNDIFNMAMMQTLDEVETEMELIKTSEVLGGVVQELKLFFNLNKVVTAAGKSIELKNVFIDFPDSANYYKKMLLFSLPKISNLKVYSRKADAKNYYIVKKSQELFELRNAERDILVSVSKENQNGGAVKEPETSVNTLDPAEQFNEISTSVKFESDLFEFDFNWDDAPVGSRIYFNLNNYYSAINSLSSRISVSKVGKTNVLRISAKSTSPFAAKVIAECLIDKFRESRIEQQKQTIRYSFKFVDEQLEEIRVKLLESEDNLSSFKASGQIISISESSSELIRYLSSLEAEKLNTDLLLSDYQNKVEEMRRELMASGYFDQSFLEPKEESRSAYTPFSSLLQRLSDYELQRLELLQKRSENHPDVINLDEQIRLAKENLAGYNQNTLTAYQIIINTLEKKLVKITNLMSRYEVRMQQLPSQEIQMARLLREKDVYEKMFTLLLDKREEMRMAEVSKLQDIVVVDPPVEPLMPISPNKRLNMLIALVLGGFIGILGIFIIELKNVKYINIDDLEDDIQLPVLALVPKFPKNVIKKNNNSGEIRDKFVTLMENNSGIKESFRVLKTKVILHGDRSEKIILITSCEENTGKTTIVANLAITFAQENKKVLVIDCDLKKAELTKLFNLSIETPGLVNYLTNEIPPSIYTKVMKKIDIIPAGGLREDSAALLDSERMKLLCESLGDSEYDFIIFDTPPVTRVVDTLVLGRFVKNALLVVRANVSFKETVLSGIQEMKQAKFKVRGIIANAVEINKSYTYRYKYGYGYGYASNNGKSKNLKAGIIKSSKKVHS